MISATRVIDIDRLEEITNNFVKSVKEGDM